MLGPSDRLFFIHVPKCGGTSLIHYLDKQFDESEIFPAQLWRQVSAVPPERISSYRLYRGHFDAGSIEPFLPKPPICITTLRDPHALAVSTYQYICREPNVGIHDYVVERNLDFGQFIRDEACVRQVQERQTRQLGLEREPNPKRLERVSDEVAARRSLAEKLELARKRLDRCVWVGIVERYDESIALLAHTMGWPAPEILPKLRQATTEADRALAPEDHERLTELNPGDLALYAYGRELFDRRYRAMLEDLTAFDEAGALKADSPDLADVHRAIDRRYRQLRREANGKRRAAAHAVTLDQPVFGNGWQEREHWEGHAWPVRWTGPSPVTTLDLAPVKAVPHRLTVQILDTVSKEALGGLEVRVGEQGVPMAVIDGAGSRVVIQGEMPASALESLDPVRIELVVPATRTRDMPGPIHTAGRAVALAIGWLDLRPAVTLEAGRLPDWSLPPSPNLRVRLRRIAGSALRRLRAHTTGRAGSR